MKSFKNFGFLLALFAVSFLVSCEDDGGGGTEAAITATISGEEVTSANVGDTVYYNVVADEGTSLINAITVRADGANLPVERFLVDGVGATNNPFLIVGDEKSSLTKEIGIIASLENTNYQIIVTADNNNTITADFIINAIGLPPTLTTSMMSDSVEVAGGTLTSFPLTGTVGDGQLSSLAVFENGVAIDASRLFFDGPQATANPIELSAEYADGFSARTLNIRADMELGSRTYQIVLEDVNGLQSVLEQKIVSVPSGTAVDVAMGVFFNRSGMQNGSFDFEGNSNVPSSSADADIRDLGNLSSTDPTWTQAIEAVNGATIKKVVENPAEGFSFESIEFKEQLTGIFDNASDYNSETVQTGDVFAVVTGAGGIFVFKVTNVVVTGNDNNDGYEIDIKK